MLEEEIMIDLMNWYFGTFECEDEEIEIVGFKNQLSFSYGNNSGCYFQKIIKGSGLNPESRIRRNKKK